MKLFGATCLIAVGFGGLIAVAHNRIADFRSSKCSIWSGTQEAEPEKESRGDFLRDQESVDQLLVPWLPTCGSMATSAVTSVIDLGRSRVELVRLECADNEAEPCRCCVRYELYEIGVDGRNDPFRRQICGATIPRPPLVDFIGECTDEELCLDPYGDAHPLAVDLLAREIVQKMSDGRSAMAFLRDRLAVNGLAWDLVIIPIEEGQLCLSRIQIIWQGFLERDDSSDVMSVRAAESALSGQVCGESER